MDFLRGRGTVHLFAVFVFVGSLFATATLAGAPPASAAGTVPVTVVITRITQFNDDIDNNVTDLFIGDFYAGVTVNGTTVDNFNHHLEFKDGGFIGDLPASLPVDAPDWLFTVPADGSQPTADVRIELWDQDNCDHAFCNDGIFNNDDDKMDISPLPDSLTAGFTVDLNTGRYAGDVNSPEHCTEGNGDQKVQVCFEVSAGSTVVDSDGDGIRDAWEQNGFYTPGDWQTDPNEAIDIDFPALGANARHKDLYLELDSEAGASAPRADILAMKKAFAAAPIDAGGNAASRTGDGGGSGQNALPNPDGLPGISLHVDTGSVVDRNAREGAPSGTCSDGIDNGRDGVIDGADSDCTFLDANVEDGGPPNCGDGIDNDNDGRIDGNDGDCLVGDNLGGGQTIPSIGACGLDDKFFAAKQTHFAPIRAPFFRYAISGQLGSGCRSTGGEGEIGGNDFIEFNHDGGTIQHELGHTLNLRHGGFDDTNCKPDYVSVMNYDNQSGVRRKAGGRILDYSPPRRALNGSTRGTKLLGPLIENKLDDGVQVDPIDADNQYVFVDPLGQKRTQTLNAPSNWNGDTDPPLELGQVVNIDTSGLGGDPAGCTNSSKDELLLGFDDWSVISLQFGQFKLSESGAVNPTTAPEPTLAELEHLEGELQAADLTVRSLATVTPPRAIIVGQPVDVTLRSTVANLGPADPRDATLTMTASAAPGATVTPATSVTPVNGLAVDTDRSVDTTFRLACNEPGDHYYLFDSTIAPAQAGDVDLVVGNNRATTAISVDCIVPIAINIAPGLSKNPVILPRSLVSVGALTTHPPEYGLPLPFDATTIKVPTVRFGTRAKLDLGGGSREIDGKGIKIDIVERSDGGGLEWHLDGDKDLLMHFLTDESAIGRDDVEACITGDYRDGATGNTYQFFGCDVIKPIVLFKS
jgi:hypothetical protein